MQPTQQMPNPNTPPPANQTPSVYDFILSEQSTKKAPKSSGAGGQKNRIILMIIGILVIFMIGVIGYSVLTKNSKDNSSNLIDNEAYQTEIIRIATLSEARSKSVNIKNFAATVLLVTKTDLGTISGILAKKKTKIAPSALLKRKNAKTDALLDAAAQNNQFDSVFETELTKLLIQYQSSLYATVQITTAKKEKQIYVDIRSNAIKLIESQTTQAAN